jgi:signal transduction histidine kinase
VYKRQIEYSQVIHNSTKKLFSLVENLLHWSRTQLGTTKYTPEQTDIYLQSQNIISLLRINAEEKDIVISSKMNKDLVAWADVNLFSTVLRNLLVNAVKFSRVGSIIQVTGKMENGQIIISVSDTGVGIRQEDLEKLFEIGTNISTKGTFNEKGTGLGLILCKEFVEINHGKIWAESTYGSGSTFHFTVPAYNENKSLK